MYKSCNPNNILFLLDTKQRFGPALEPEKMTRRALRPIEKETTRGDEVRIEQETREKDGETVLATCVLYYHRASERLNL